MVLIQYASSEVRGMTLLQPKSSLRESLSTWVESTTNVVTHSFFVWSDRQICMARSLLASVMAFLKHATSHERPHGWSQSSLRWALSSPTLPSTGHP